MPVAYEFPVPSDTSMIRQLGCHSGKVIVFGYDRYLLPELDGYLEILRRYGSVVEPVDRENLHYLSSAERVCSMVQGDPGVMGVLCCGTGMGMSIAANKIRQIYAARCVTVDDANLARTINNANVLCIAASSGLALNAKIVDSFMRTPFEGRKVEQLEYIAQLELEAEPAQQASASIAPRVLQKTA